MAQRTPPNDMTKNRIPPLHRRVLLARHGETAWNVMGRRQGHTDVALNETGREQARVLARGLEGAGVASIWTSDLSRARETGEIVARALGLPPPHIERDLRERAFGIFEGLTPDECAAQYPDDWRRWQDRIATPPGGEADRAVVERMSRVLSKIASAEHGPILVVSHGAVMRLWLGDIAGGPIPLIANGEIHTVEHRPHERGILWSRIC